MRESKVIVIYGILCFQREIELSEGDKYVDFMNCLMYTMYTVVDILSAVLANQSSEKFKIN